MTKLWQGRDTVSVAELAPMLGVTPRTVRRRIEAGRIKATVNYSNRGAAGMEYRIPVEEALKLVRQEGIVDLNVPVLEDDDLGNDRPAGQDFPGQNTGQDQGHYTDDQKNMMLQLFAQKESQIGQLAGEVTALKNERDYLRNKLEEYENKLVKKMEDQERRIEERDKMLMDLINEIRKRDYYNNLPWYKKIFRTISG